MKKDIDIPEVKDVFMAVVREENKEFRSLDWNAYVINDRSTPIDTVLIVTRGYDEKDATATMRHTIKELPPQSFAKVEFLQEEVLKLINEFSVSFFAEGKLFHKKFNFRKNSINENALRELPVMQQKGVLAE
ncbi:hypothetical protein GCM10007103_00800 [Salinimicrobium marinum]|uniref:Phenylalanyl-tRNA synthetase subunit alpha n=1 Tax=Salinimicrobium marinum TaxID=680283 RepID=A0A918VTD3_9FLAO|nr:hypothetical protein [Salinimicrobium marinum]GHA23590.1 hypothetical protein GCM10007103_00800 [Salinimicrobium marinum]